MEKKIDNGSTHRGSSTWRKFEKKKSLNDYKDISDYALIGDQSTCALVSMTGSIDWFCMPRFDSPSVFGALLDVKKGGTFQILPWDEEFEARQYYEGMTNILITEFRTASGLSRITDFMPCFQLSGTIVSTGEIHRRISCIEGKSDLEVRIQPRPNYGTVIPKIEKFDHAGYTFIPTKGNTQELTLATQLDFQTLNGSLRGSLTLNKEDKQDLVLRYGGFTLKYTPDSNTDEKLKETRSYWSKWAKDCDYNGKWKDQVIRSALALKELVYSRTGAVLAAATTSLPEEMGGSRNWDYRYSWIRDSSFVLWALHSLGHKQAEFAYTQLITSTFYLTSESIQVMIGITGDRVLTEKKLTHLEGYRKSFPVRIGNGAWNQVQLDVYGILLDALYFSHLHGRTISNRVYNHMIVPILQSVKVNWSKPDCGIWEVRGERKHFVYSKVWCWVALDRAIKIAETLEIKEDIAGWIKLRDEIKEEIMSRGWNGKINSFVRDFGSTDMDAANLLMPQVRFIDGADPKMLSTIEQIKKELLYDRKFLYRYKANDGLQGKEGAFLICSFWLASCLALAGKLDEAEQLLDSLLECSNHVGLFSEEYDPKKKKMLGNFPQAFTHMGFITAATTIEREKQKLAKRLA